MGGIDKLSTMENSEREKKFTLRGFLSLGEVGEYFFRKKDPSRPSNVNIRVMHGINKISIAIFLLAVIYLVAKRFVF
jgi:hypothetical protein